MKANYEQGIYQDKDLTRIQRWSLLYFMYERDREDIEKQDEYFKIMTMIGNMELYRKVFVENEERIVNENDALSDGSGFHEISAQEFSEDDELQAYLQSMFSGHNVVVGDLPDENDDGNGVWQ